MSELSHLDSQGRAIMVDVGAKAETERTAQARGVISMSQAAFERLRQGSAKKGDVLGVARIGGIMALKRTWELIPLCHNIPLTGCTLDFDLDEANHRVAAICTVRTVGRTGVEMEALTGVSVALLTIYDMLKAVDRSMVLGEIRLVKKSGGKSGDYENP